MVVAYDRLYIGRQLAPLDPSLSLHDDPETAVTSLPPFSLPSPSLLYPFSLSNSL
jgi:hypothetical protein